ncbi:peroxiredoxin [Rhizomicrobium palustre]|uniref:thioredoxin-dependent peroxiredoxin n=1 Tax=Rhizomicrobium palustre TaxID=189966 RepID=A0A846N271_9PROT|nr:peroxiredoxin [Rhizomicrobium palustre]NIK90084.1 peroxiredoxin [Rhizomicrobium palustre]
MKLLYAAALGLGIAAAPAEAALSIGAAAPDFTTEASLGGKVFSFSLADALKKGPVVLYFYPKSFTKGCTIEAHEFAEATEKFAASGATVIGVSNDDIATQQKFSTEECRNKFAVAADPNGKVIRAYDAKMPVLAMSNRISYVITPDHKVAFVHSDMSPDQHVTLTLDAVKKWKDGHK